MRKRLIRIMVIALGLVMVLQNMCFADVIVPGAVQYLYDVNEKIEMIYRWMPSPAKELIFIFISLFIVVGITLLILKIMKVDKEKKRLKILEKLFFVINIILSLLLIYLFIFIRYYLFGYATTTGIGVTFWDVFIPYTIYFIIIIISCIVSIRKKNCNIIYDAALILTFLIAILCCLYLCTMHIPYWGVSSDILEMWNKN